MERVKGGSAVRWWEGEGEGARGGVEEQDEDKEGLDPEGRIFDGRGTICGTESGR